MRYRDGVVPNPDQPYGESMHAMLTLSAVLGIVFGLAMLWLARRGRGSVWLAWWSGGLALSGVGYLVADLLGLPIARI